MKKLPLFLVVFSAIILGACGINDKTSDENFIKLGTAKLSTEVLIFDAPGHSHDNTFNVDSMLDMIEIYGTTKSVFSHEDEELTTPLKRDFNLYSGDIPVDCREGIGGIRLYADGHFLGGATVVLNQNKPVVVRLSMDTDGNVIDANASGLELKDLESIAGIGEGSISRHPSMFMPPKEMYNSWKDVRAYQIDSIWPRYQKESIGTNSVPEEVADWLMNNLKITFATYCILPYVRNAKELSGIAVEEPPMETYAFLDSIDYSPDVFLKTNMLISPRNFLQQILKYPCGGMESIGEMPVDRWQNMVSRKLQPAMKERPKLLLDLLAGMSYIQQIEDNLPLTDKQKRNIAKGFTDDIGKIVLAKNDRMLGMKNDIVSLHDITTEPFALQKYIDENYAGRPVAVDMWNTWCAPCLNAIYQTEDIKHSFANTDLVFLYISDESSGLEEWKRRAKHIGGEQVRISEDASEALQNSYNLTGFPSYLFFDSNHRLVHAQTAFPGLNRYTELLNKISR